MVTMLDSGSNVQVQAVQGHCVVFLGKTLYTHACISPPRSVLMGTGELSRQPDKNTGGLPAIG